MHATTINLFENPRFKSFTLANGTIQSPRIPCRLACVLLSFIADGVYA